MSVAGRVPSRVTGTGSGSSGPPVPGGPLTGDADILLDAITLVGAGEIVSQPSIEGNAAIQLANITLSSTASLAIKGNAAIQLDNLAVAATGTVGGADLRSGYSFRLDASKASTYPSGIFPAANANLASFADQVTGAVANKTSTKFATFVENTVDGMHGIKFTGTTAYTILHAAVPANYMTQAVPGKSAQHWVFEGLGDAGTTGVMLAYAGPSGRVEITSRPTTDGNLAGCGIQQTGANVRISISDMGVNILSVDSTTDKIQGNPGTGLVGVYLNGVCIGRTTVPLIGLGATSDMIFGAVTVTGTAGSTILTLREHVYYPESAGSAQIYKDVKILAAKHGKVLPTKHVLYINSSLGMGTGASAAAYAIVGQINAMLGIANNPAVHNLSSGGASNIGINTLVDQALELIEVLGPENCMVCVGEGYNTIANGLTSALQAVEGGGVNGGIGIVGILRRFVTAGIPPERLLLPNLTGVATSRGGYAKVPEYVSRINNITTSHPEFEGIQIVDYASDPNFGVAPDAATKGGFYGNTGVPGESGGANGLGENGDGYNGLTVSAVEGGAGDGVHRSGRSGGSTGTISGYYLMAQRYVVGLVSDFLGL